jgi:hypothetical protein
MKHSRASSYWIYTTSTIYTKLIHYTPHCIPRKNKQKTTLQPHWHHVPSKIQRWRTHQFVPWSKTSQKILQSSQWNVFSLIPRYHLYTNNNNINQYCYCYFFFLFLYNNRYCYLEIKYHAEMNNNHIIGNTLQGDKIQL